MMLHHQHVLAGWEIEDKIRGATSGKADKHEVYSLDSRVGRLEDSLRQAGAEIDGLRYRMQVMEARLDRALAALGVEP